MPNNPNARLPEVPRFLLASSDFAPGEALPQASRSGIARAGGEDRSPQLTWTGAPPETRSYAITMFDPDAPTGSGWWHWAAYDIPAATTELAGNAGDPAADLMPEGTVTLANEIRLERYLGAAPPAGHGQHRYFFTVSALDVDHLDLPAGSTPAYLGFVLRDHIIGRAQLIGTSITP